MFKRFVILFLQTVQNKFCAPSFVNRRSKHLYSELQCSESSVIWNVVRLAQTVRFESAGQALATAGVQRG